MGKDQPIFVKDAVFKLQMSLFEGIQNEEQLFAAGTLVSKSDYEDVVTERSILNICGYPLCRIALPSDRPRKGRYRISLKEHKVYDLHETYMYCSSSCVVNSKAFARSLQDERCSVLEPEKLNNVLRLFGDLNMEPMEKIQDKINTSTGEVSLKQWTGPSNAIEGYVPKQRDSDSKGSSRKNINKGSKASHGKLNGDKNLIINEMDFMSTIIIPDEYSVSKVPSGQTETTTDHQIKQTAVMQVLKRVGRKVVRKDDNSVQELSSSFKSDGASTSNLDAANAKPKSSLKSAVKRNLVVLLLGRMRNTTALGVKIFVRLKNLEISKKKPDLVGDTDVVDDEDMFHRASAEAYVNALNQASEAVASGDLDVADAVSEAGIIILPCPHDADEEVTVENVDMPETDSITLKWPREPGISDVDVFDSEDSCSSKLVPRAVPNIIVSVQSRVYYLRAIPDFTASTHSRCFPVSSSPFSVLPGFAQAHPCAFCFHPCLVFPASWFSLGSPLCSVFQTQVGFFATHLSSREGGC